MRKFLPIAALCVILISGGHSLGAATEVITLDDIVALLGADVGESIILRQLNAESTSLENLNLDVAAILTLKEAGASDRLIEGLMDIPVSPEQQASQPSGILDPPEDAGREEGDSQLETLRIFKEKDDQGREYLHITNLDAAGRRIGGPSTHRQENSVSQYDSGKDDRGYSNLEDDYDDYREPEPPVIVNVYPPPAPEGVAPHDHQDAARWRGGRYASTYPGGRLPGYYGFNTAYGNRFGRGVPSPPGSYSHFISRHGHDSRLYNGTLAYRARHASGVRRHRPDYRMIGPASGRESITRYRSHFKNRR